MAHDPVCGVVDPLDRGLDGDQRVIELGLIVIFDACRLEVGRIEREREEPIHLGVALFDIADDARDIMGALFAVTPVAGAAGIDG